MIGVEEEFFIVDEETLFPASFTPKLILRLIKKDFCYFAKSSMESPVERELVRAGFPIIELKTSPHRDVDCLLDEIKHNRGMLADVAREEHVLIVPCGLYPTHDPEKDSSLLCCAIHVHVSGYPLRKAFYALAERIPELVALTANSPFLGGRVSGNAMRVLYSYAIGIPKGFYKKTGDVIINRRLQTVELKVCDTQIVSKNVLDLASLVFGIVDSYCKADKPEKTLNPVDLDRKRRLAAVGGRSAIGEGVKRLYDEMVPSLDQFGTSKIVYQYIMNSSSPASFQIDVASRHGVANVVQSLWASFQKDELEVSNTIKTICRNYTVRSGNLPHLLFYSPINLYNLFRKLF